MEFWKSSRPPPMARFMLPLDVTVTWTHFLLQILEEKKLVKFKKRKKETTPFFQNLEKSYNFLGKGGIVCLFFHLHLKKRGEAKKNVLHVK